MPESARRTKRRYAHELYSLAEEGGRCLACKAIYNDHTRKTDTQEES